MVEQIKKMVQKRQLEYIKPVEGPTAQIYRKMMNEMVRVCHELYNDSMHTSLCLQFST
jgi:hypothetical protein